MNNSVSGIFTISKDDFDLRVQSYQDPQSDSPISIEKRYKSHFDALHHLIKNDLKTGSTMDSFTFPVRPSYICVYNVYLPEHLDKIVEHLNSVRRQTYALVLVDTDVSYILSNIGNRDWPTQELHCSRTLNRETSVRLSKYPRRFSMPSLRIVSLDDPGLLDLWNNLDMDLSEIEILRLNMIGYLDSETSHLTLHPSIKNIKILDLYQFTVIDDLVFEQLPSTLELLRFSPTKGHSPRFYQSLESGKMSNLRTLHIGNCDRIIDLSKLPNLVDLRVDFMPEVSDRLHIEHCTHLRSIGIRHKTSYHIDYGSSYVDLKELRALNIVSDKGILSYDDRFDELPKLRYVSIDQRLTFKRSLCNIKDLQILILNNITPSAMRSISPRRFMRYPRLYITIPHNIPEWGIFRMLDTELAMTDAMINRELVRRLKNIREMAYMNRRRAMAPR